LFELNIRSDRIKNVNANTRPSVSTLGLELTWPNTEVLTLCQYSIIKLINVINNNDRLYYCVYCLEIPLAVSHLERKVILQ